MYAGDLAEAIERTQEKKGYLITISAHPRTKALKIIAI